jgi:hypothetical protein
MKLLIVAAIKDYSKQVSALLKKTNIPVFSILDAVGVKNNLDLNLADDWFGRGVGEFDSVFVISFTTDDYIEKVFKEIELFNEAEAGAFPIRAFVLPVDKSLTK